MLHSRTPSHTSPVFSTTLQALPDMEAEVTAIMVHVATKECVLSATAIQTEVARVAAAGAVAGATPTVADAYDCLEKAYAQPGFCQAMQGVRALPPHHALMSTGSPAFPTPCTPR